MSMKPKVAEAAVTIEGTVAPAETATPKVAGAGTSTPRIDMSPANAGPEANESKVKQDMEKAMKTAEEFVAFGQGNVEAFMKSSQIWAAGVQDLSKQVAATAQANFDQTMSTFKAMSTIKSLKDAFELQAGLARATMEKTMAESGRLTDASLKLTEQALAPITARVTLAVEKFGKAV